MVTDSTISIIESILSANVTCNDAADSQAVTVYMPASGSWTTSNFTVTDSALASHCASSDNSSSTGSDSAATVIWARCALTDSFINIKGSELTATCPSGKGYGLWAPNNLTRAYFNLTASRFKVVAGGGGASVIETGNSFIPPVLAEASVQVAESNLTSTSSGGDAYGIHSGLSSGMSAGMMVDIVGSTLHVSYSGSNGGSGFSVVGMVFDGPLTENSRITLERSVVMSVSGSSNGLSRSLIFADKDVGSIALANSRFTGATDGIGPLNNTLRHTIKGALDVRCVYWNDDTTPMNASLQAAYPSSTLAVAVVGCSPTVTATASLTMKPEELYPTSSSSEVPGWVPPLTLVVTPTPTSTAASNTTTVVPVSIPSTASPTTASNDQYLTLTAVEVGHWTGLFVLSTNNTNGAPLYNVTVEVSVEASVALMLQSNSTYCTDNIGRTAVVCTVSILPADTSANIYVLVISSLSYQFNGPATLRYSAEANSSATPVAPLTGYLTLIPRSNSTTVVGSSVDIPTAVLRATLIQDQCVDFFIFLSMGSVLLIVVVLLVVATCYTNYERESATHSSRSAMGEDKGEPCRGSTHHPCADPYPNTWVDIPLWRSLALQHAYCIVPCHSQCVLNHVLPLVTHIFTLMMLCAAISATFWSRDLDLNAVAVTTIVSVILATGLRPGLLGIRFYWRFTAVEGSSYSPVPTLSARGHATGCQSQEQLGVQPTDTTDKNTTATTTIMKQLRGLQRSDSHKLQMEASMAALENIELQSDATATHLEGGTTTGTLTGTDVEFTFETTGGTGDLEFGGTREATAGQECTTELKGKIAEDRQQLSEVEDDIIVLDNEEALVEKEKGDVAGGTIQALEEEVKNCGGDINFGEEEEAVDVAEEAQVDNKIVPNVVTTSTDAEGSTAKVDPPMGRMIVVTPHRIKGHLTLSIVLVLCGVVTISILLSIKSSEACSTFETAFFLTVLLDFIVAQPLVVGLTYLYRWLQSEEDDTIWSELHPFDGEFRDELM